MVGIGEGFTCLSSDLPSILPLTRKIIRLEDGEIITLWADKVELHSVKDGSLIEREPELILEEMTAVQKGGYAHFMLKEINEQPAVARELLHVLAENEVVASMIEKIKNARHVYLIGCGTSYHACQAGSVYFAQLAKKAAIPVVATQFIPQYLPAVGSGDVGIFVSQSGETKDVLNAINASKESGMTCFGLSNVIGSTLTRSVSAWLPLCCGYEISVPATKTFTNQIVAFLFLAYKLGGLDTRELDQLPGLMEETIKVTTPQVDALTPLHQSLERPLLPGIWRYLFHGA